jgi:hypothetical protein
LLSDSLCSSVVARSNDIIKKLVLEAKREYEKDAEHRVHIFLADTYAVLLAIDDLILSIPLVAAHTVAGGGTALGRNAP